MVFSSTTLPRFSLIGFSHTLIVFIHCQPCFHQKVLLLATITTLKKRERKKLEKKRIWKKSSIKKEEKKVEKKKYYCAKEKKLFSRCFPSPSLSCVFYHLHDSTISMFHHYCFLSSLLFIYIIHLLTLLLLPTSPRQQSTPIIALSICRPPQYRSSLI